MISYDIRDRFCTIIFLPCLPFYSTFVKIDLEKHTRNNLCFGIRVFHFLTNLQLSNEEQNILTSTFLYE